MEIIRDEYLSELPHPFWRRATCDECKSETGMVVEMGETPAYESATAHICKDCLIKALKLIEGA